MKKLRQSIKNVLGEKNTARIKKALPAIRIIKKIICWILIVLLVLTLVTFMLTRLNGEAPSLFGYSLHRIVSGSMEPELEVGDVLLNKNISDASEIRVGDIVTFSGVELYGDREVTHRVKVAPYYDGNGNIVLVTKGDANDVDDGEISFGNVRSKYIRKLPILNFLYNFFFSVWGLIIFIILLLVIFIDEIASIFRLSSKKAEKEESESFRETMKRIEREEKEKSEKEKDRKKE